MKYLGGKHNIGLQISTFLKSHYTDDLNGYLEPFCGSLGVFKHMSVINEKPATANDIQPDIIQLWKELQDNTLHVPTSFSQNEYNESKLLSSPSSLKAISGFGLSFGGKWFGGYAQKSAGNSGRNYLSEFRNSIEPIKKSIQRDNVFFERKSYFDFEPVNMLIYCDPPYKSTQRYSTGQFDSELFWNTMRKWSEQNVVFISEQTAPNDFKIVWTKPKLRTLQRKNRIFMNENIYCLK